MIDNFTGIRYANTITFKIRSIYTFIRFNCVLITLINCWVERVNSFFISFINNLRKQFLSNVWKIFINGKFSIYLLTFSFWRSYRESISDSEVPIISVLYNLSSDLELMIAEECKRSSFSRSVCLTFSKNSLQIKIHFSFS